MTDEEYIAKGMLLGLKYNEAYQAFYVEDGLRAKWGVDFGNRYLDRDTLEPVSLEERQRRVGQDANTLERHLWR